MDFTNRISPWFWENSGNKKEGKMEIEEIKKLFEKANSRVDSDEQWAATAEIRGTCFSIIGTLLKLVEDLQTDLKFNASILAKQTDLAREAEMDSELQQRHNDLIALYRDVSTKLRKAEVSLRLIKEWIGSHHGELGMSATEAMLRILDE